ncbi:MAG: pitrilysin family protein [Oscillospiraceae bacterium]
MNKASNAVRTAAEYEEIHLDNGLTVLVKEMPDFCGVHAVYSTAFGSIESGFIADGKKYDLPAGIAHFLEHKMFENEDGDAFELYAKTGASANAYTSFDKTSYIFSATDNIDASLDILLSFVSHPYFTKETVLKEQGIIGQEIQMYDDSPSWRLLFAITGALYHNHPLRVDIAGTVETIAEITPELLYACTDAFYRPENMVLAAAGNITKAQLLAACERAGIAEKKGEVVRLPKAEPQEINQQETELYMSVSKPLLGIGFKENPSIGEEFKNEIICDLLTDLIIGDMTPLYRELYDKGLISADFSGELLNVDGAFAILFSGETQEPEEVRSRLFAEIELLRENGVPKEVFTLCKNALYGELVSNLENVDDMASGMATVYFKHRTMYDEIQALAAVTVENVDELLQTVLRREHSASVIIRPIEEE